MAVRGGKNKLLGISKRDDKNIQRLLVPCALAAMQRLERQFDHRHEAYGPY